MKRSFNSTTPLLPGLRRFPIAPMIFFYARLSYTVIYTMGIPLLRTIVFFVGFICEAVQLVQFLG